MKQVCVYHPSFENENKRQKQSEVVKRCKLGPDLIEGFASISCWNQSLSVQREIQVYSACLLSHSRCNIPDQRPFSGKAFPPLTFLAKKKHATRRRASTHSPAKLGASLPVSWQNGPLVDPNSMAYRISHSVCQPACSGPHANKARSLRIPQLLAHSLSYLALFGRPFQSGCSKRNGSLILICPDLSATASKEPPDSGHPPANAWSERTAYSSTSRDKSPDCKSGSCWHDPRCTFATWVRVLEGTVSCWV